MPIVYTQNFDTTALGSLPPDWTPPDSSNWAVQNTVVVSGSTQALGCQSADNSYIVCTAFNAIPDVELRLDVNPGTSQGFTGPVIRFSGDGQNGYFITPDSANLNDIWHFFSRVGGVNTVIKTFAVAGTITGSVSMRFRAEGSLLSVTVWPFGTTEPAVTSTLVDTTITAAGFVGLRNQGPGTPLSGVNNVSVDNLTTFATDFTFTPSSLTTTVGVATGNYTITPNAVPSATTFISLTDAGQGGTFTPPSPLTFDDATAQTFTYTPAVSGTVPLTATATGGFTTSHGANAVSNPPPASDFTLTPSTQNGTVGTPTSAYSITPNGVPAGALIVAMSDAGQGGTFIPPGPYSLTTSGVQTFTYIAASNGTKTLTASGSGAFTAIHTAICQASGGGGGTNGLRRAGMLGGGFL